MPMKHEKRVEARDKLARRGRPKGSKDKHPRATGARALRPSAPRQPPPPPPPPPRAPPKLDGGTCPKCSAPTSDGQMRCTDCGADLRGNVCGNCERPTRPTDKYCAYCGDERAAVEEKAPEPKEEEPPTAPPPPPAPSPPRAALAAADDGEMDWPPETLELMLQGIDTMLVENYKTTPLSQKEIDAVVKPWHRVLVKRAKAQGPNADLWAAGVTTLFVFAPHVFAAVMFARRQRQLDAEASSKKTEAKS